MSDQPVQVFEGWETDATLVQVALDHEGIRVEMQLLPSARVRQRCAVFVIDPKDVTRARQIVTRHLNGSLPSGVAIGLPWPCPRCGEVNEGQFQACWKCGVARDWERDFSSLAGLGPRSTPDLRRIAAPGTPERTPEPGTL